MTDQELVEYFERWYAAERFVGSEVASGTRKTACSAAYAAGFDVDRWQPIDEHTPRDRPLLLFYRSKVGCASGTRRGNWNPDKSGSPPRPYWTNDESWVWGIRNTRANQPTHWQELPDAPECYR